MSKNVLIRPIACLRRRNFVKDLGKNPGEYFSHLYFDMSGTRSAGALQTALEMTDAKHILWGSDFPANQNFKDSLSVIAQNILSVEQRNLILGENFRVCWFNSSTVRYAFSMF